MQLSEDLRKLCDLKIPGLNRVKWWIHEKCKLYDNKANSAKTNGKQQISLYTNQANGSSSQNLPLYDQATALIQDLNKVKKNGNDQPDQFGNICFICRK